MKYNKSTLLSFDMVMNCHCGFSMSNHRRRLCSRVVLSPFSPWALMLSLKYAPLLLRLDSRYHNGVPNCFSRLALRQEGNRRLNSPTANRLVRRHLRTQMKPITESLLASFLFASIVRWNSILDVRFDTKQPTAFDTWHARGTMRIVRVGQLPHPIMNCPGGHYIKKILTRVWRGQTSAGGFQFALKTALSTRTASAHSLKPKDVVRSSCLNVWHSKRSSPSMSGTASKTLSSCIRVRFQSKLVR